MRPRESKTFAEILIRLREGKQTEQEILTFRQREVEENYAFLDIPHLFIENSQVDAFNDKVYNSAPGIKFTIQASVTGAISDELREKILKQMPVIHPQKYKQLVPNLRITEGERTEVAINAKTDDRITNGAGNVFKKVQLQIYNRPTGIVWVQFDNADVGRK